MPGLPKFIDSTSRAPRAPRPVLVIGEALIDRFTDGDVIGGAPFNVARSLAAFGVPTTFISRIGDNDDAGARVLASALRFGLHDRSIQRDLRRATGVATVIERRGEHRFEIHADAAWDDLDLSEARSALRAAAPGIVYFGTLAQRSAASARTIDALLEQTAALRYLDLNLRPGQDNREVARHSLERADWVSVNADELRTLLVWFVPQADAAAADDSAALRDGIRCLLQRFRVARLIVTRSDRGYAAFDLRGRCIAQGAAQAVTRVVDTVGAGDAFSAAFIALQSAGCTAAVSLAAANRCAAALCGQRGALPEGAAFFRGWRAALGLQQRTPALV
jgi:fructokinase